MAVMPERDYHEWIDLADSLDEMAAQNKTFLEIVSWLDAKRRQECPDLNKLSTSRASQMSNDTLRYYMGYSNGLHAGISAAADLRDYCLQEAARIKRKESKK